jgi:hypothetical protein
MISLSIFENHIIHESCGIIKLLPAERMPSFAIHHFYTATDENFPKKNTHPVFASSEHIQAGMLQIGTLRIEAGYFDDLKCWQPIVRKNREEQYRAMVTAGLVGGSSVTSDTPVPSAPREFDSPILVQEGKTIYSVENGTRHMVPSREVFEAHHFDWDAVMNPHDLTGYGALPKGEDLR